MRRSLLTKTILTAFLDCLFCYLGWIGSVFVFTYLFDARVMDFTLFWAVNYNFWVIILACVLFNAVCGVYKSLWRHPGIGSVLRLIAALFMTSFTMYVSLRVRLGFWPNPGLGVMAFYFLLTMSISVRMYKKILWTVRQYAGRFIKLSAESAEEPVRTLIVGAGDSASAFLLNKNWQGARPREILGIVDNDAMKHGYGLHGVNILGSDAEIPGLVKNLNIDEIIVAVPSMKNEDLRRIIKHVPSSRCKVRLLSGLSTDKAGERLRNVDIGDLLGRAEVKPDDSGVKSWIKGRTVLITGGGGTIGSELCHQILDFGAEKIVLFDISENNVYNLKQELKIKHGQKGLYRIAARIGSVQDKRRLNEVFAEFKPSVVFHAAAYKHVPLVEECPELAVENNVLGTYETAICAINHNVKRFVLISTDKAVNPTNIMGASKRLAELLVLGLNRRKITEFMCVRFGNVLESNGSVIPLFKRQIEHGGPVTVTHQDMIRYFMTINEAVRLVLEAGFMAKGGEIFILDMGEPVKIKELADNLIRMSGLTPDIDIKIEYIGLRPGEKLYEELLLTAEGIKKTVNDKIFVVDSPEAPDLSEAPDFLKEARAVISEKGDTRGFVKRFVPEYMYSMEERK